MAGKGQAGHPALETWKALNEHLMKADEKGCLALLRLERRGKKRSQYMVRIHHRYNKLRGRRERRELTEE